MICNVSIMTRKRGSSKQDPNIVQSLILCLYIYILKIFCKFQLLFYLQRQWLIKMTSNESNVWKFFNVKATTDKKLSALYVEKNFRE